MGKTKGLISKTSDNTTLKFSNTKGKEDIELVWKGNEIHIYRNKRYFDKITLGDVVSGGSPGGDDTQIQFNDSGDFGASSSLTFTEPSGQATVTLGSENPLNDAQIILGLDTAISFTNALRRLNLTARSGNNGDILLDAPATIESSDTEYYHNTVSAAVSNPPTAAEIAANKPNGRVLPSSGSQSPSYHLYDTTAGILYKCTYVAGIGWKYLTYTSAV